MWLRSHAVTCKAVAESTSPQHARRHRGRAASATPHQGWPQLHEALEPSLRMRSEPRAPHSYVPTPQCNITGEPPATWHAGHGHSAAGTIAGACRPCVTWRWGHAVVVSRAGEIMSPPRGQNSWAGGARRGAGPSNAHAPLQSPLLPSGRARPAGRAAARAATRRGRRAPAAKNTVAPQGRRIAPCAAAAERQPPAAKPAAHAQSAGRALRAAAPCGAREAAGQSSRGAAQSKPRCSLVKAAVQLGARDLVQRLDERGDAQLRVLKRASQA